MSDKIIKGLDNTTEQDRTYSPKDVKLRINGMEISSYVIDDYITITREDNTDNE